MSPRRHSAVLLVIAVLVVIVVAMLLVKTARGNYWDALARCETGGQWHQRGSYYVGGLGIWYGNWWRWGRAVGVNKPAYLASREEQIRVAMYGRKVDGATWGCFKIVGLPW